MRLLLLLRLINTTVIRGFDHIAQTQGMQKAAQWLLSNLDLRIQKKSGTFVQHDPQIIIANHSGIFDVMSIVSHLKRDDVYFIMVSVGKIFGKTHNTYLLPIYLSNKPADTLAESIRRLYFTYREGNMSRKQAMKQNRETISRAAQIVSNGGTVIIFPTGGDIAKKKAWKAGIGFLIRQVTNPKTRIVFVHIDGARRLDMLRYVNPYIRKLFFAPKNITLTIAKPFSIKKFQSNHYSGKEIATDVKNTYNQIFP